MKKNRLLIKNGVMLAMDKGMHTYTEQTLVVENGRIAAFLPHEQALREYPDGRTIDAAGMVVLPGLVNTHMHSNLVRGFGDNMALYEWHEEIAELVGHNTSPEDAYLGALVSYTEALQSGTTTLLGLEKYAPLCYKAAEESGIRARITPYILDFDDCEDTVEMNIEYVEKTKDPDARVKFFFGFDSFREAGPDMIRRIAGLSKEYGIPMQTHSNESTDDVALCREQYHMDPIVYLHSLGALTERTILAHGVHLSEEELRLVEQAGAKIAHCIISNMKLCDGVAPITKYISRGVGVGLGTDGANSNNNYDLFEEMKAATLLQRVICNRADAYTAPEALQLATIRGAEVLGLQEEIGSLEIGKRADIILLDMQKLHCLPFDPRYPSVLISNIVYSAHGSDVHTVIVDGEIVMENRKMMLIDEEKLLKEANAAGRKLMERLVAKGLKL